MILKLLGALSLAALPATAMATSITDTHVQVSTPGKSAVAFRPIASRSGVTKCHPEASKAVACEVQAAIARRDAALARRDAAKATELTRR